MIDVRMFTPAMVKLEENTFWAELNPWMLEISGLATWLVMVWLRARFSPWSMKNVPSVTGKLGIPVLTTIQPLRNPIVRDRARATSTPTQTFVENSKLNRDAHRAELVTATPADRSNSPPFRNASSFTSVLYVSTTYGLMAAPVALLMIGGEFDLSAGVAVTSSALCASLFSFEFSTNVWVGVLVALALSLTIGFLNGWIVVKTGIPSFLVTLGTFFMLQGLNLALTQTITNQVASPDISNIQGFSSAQKVFSSSFTIAGVNIRTSIIYWIVVVAIATWILLRPRLGNWIFSVGGSAPSARAVGVPVARMKIGLFMAVGLLAWFTGMIILFQFNTIQSGQGVGNE